MSSEEEDRVSAALTATAYGVDVGDVLSSDEEADFCGEIIRARSRQKTPKVWLEEWLKKRDTHGSYASIFEDVKMNDTYFLKYLHMPFEIYETILAGIEDKIEKKRTNMRPPIPAGARLLATLLYLIEGKTYSRLQWSTLIDQTTLGKIIPETCQAIFDRFNEEYFKVFISC